MAAGIFNAQELVLADDEAKSYAEAIADVAKYYSPDLDPKLLAWFNLAMVAGGIYGTRLFAIRARLKAEEKPAAPANVVSMRKETTTAVRVAQTPADMFGLGYSGDLATAE